MSKNKNLIVALGAVLMMAVASMVGAGGGRPVAPKEAQELLAKGKIHLVDVREAGELMESGTAKDALWLPMSVQSEGTPEMKAFLEKVAAGGKKEKELVFFCRSGRRSGMAAEAFQKLGFKTGNMGGFSGWVDAGLPTMPKP